jgi:hypothetical protein
MPLLASSPKARCFSSPSCKLNGLPADELMNTLADPARSGRLNALISVTEINSLYDQRPIVEKQASYVYPFAEAFGGIIADLPIKLASAVLFNVTIHFLGRRVSQILRMHMRLLSHS